MDLYDTLVPVAMTLRVQAWNREATQRATLSQATVTASPASRSKLEWELCSSLSKARWGEKERDLASERAKGLLRVWRGLPPY